MSSDRLDYIGQADFGYFNHWDEAATIVVATKRSAYSVVAWGSGNADQVELYAARTLSVEQDWRFTEPQREVRGLVAAAVRGVAAGSYAWSSENVARAGRNLPLNAGIVVDAATGEEVSLVVGVPRKLVALLQAVGSAVSGDAVAASGGGENAQCSLGYYDGDTFRPATLAAGTYYLYFQRLELGLSDSTPAPLAPASFGGNAKTAYSATGAATSGAAFVAAVTCTTDFDAPRGIFIVRSQGRYSTSNANRRGEARLYNVTDAVIVSDGAEVLETPSSDAKPFLVYEGYVTFTGFNKTFSLQIRDDGVGPAALHTIDLARIWVEGPLADA